MRSTMLSKSICSISRRVKLEPFRQQCRLKKHNKSIINMKDINKRTYSKNILFVLILLLPVPFMSYILFFTNDFHFSLETKILIILSSFIFNAPIL